MVSRQCLREIPLFAELPEKVLLGVAAAARLRPVAAHRVLFSEGEPVNAFYVLVRGRVRISALFEDGEENAINVLGDGEFFPHTGFLAGGAYPATASTLVDTELAVLPSEDLAGLIRQFPELAFQLLLEMGRRVDILQTRVRELAQRDLRLRVLCVLARLCRVQRVAFADRRPEDDPVLLVPLTHDDLARLSGGARESVSRILADLRREGVVLPSAPARLAVRVDRLEQALAALRGCPALNPVRGHEPPARLAPPLHREPLGMPLR